MSELKHHGIKGMKWGVRRFQNPDGTLTSAGRRRLQGSVSFDSNGRVSDNDSGRVRSGIHNAVATDYRNASSGLQSASNIARTASNMKDKAQTKKRTKAMSQIDLSNMSDKELRAAIDRLNLERNYKSLTAENLTSGNNYVSDILSTAGDVLAIGASAASIAVAIHTIRG